MDQERGQRQEPEQAGGEQEREQRQRPTVAPDRGRQGEDIQGPRLRLHRPWQVDTQGTRMRLHRSWQVHTDPQSPAQPSYAAVAASPPDRHRLRDPVVGAWGDPNRRTADRGSRWVTRRADADRGGGQRTRGRGKARGGRKRD